MSGELVYVAVGAAVLGVVFAVVRIILLARKGAGLKEILKGLRR